MQFFLDLVIYQTISKYVSISLTYKVIFIMSKILSKKRKSPRLRKPPASKRVCEEVPGTAGTIDGCLSENAGPMPINNAHQTEDEVLSKNGPIKRLIRLKSRRAEEDVTCAAFSPTKEAHILAVGAENGAIFLYDTTNVGEGFSEWETGGREGAKIKRRLFFHHKAPLMRISHFSNVANQQLFLSGSTDGHLALWNACTGIAIQHFPVRLSKLTDLAVCSAWPGTQFLTAHGDCGVRLFYPDRPNYLRLLPHEHPVQKIALRKRMAATLAGEERQIRIWDLNSGKLVRTFERIDTKGAQLLEFMDDDRLLCVDSNGLAMLIQISSGSVLTSCNLPLENPADECILSHSHNSSHANQFWCGTNQGNLFTIQSSPSAELAVQIEQKIESDVPAKIRVISSLDDNLTVLVTK